MQNYFIYISFPREYHVNTRERRLYALQKCEKSAYENSN